MLPFVGLLKLFVLTGSLPAQAQLMRVVPGIFLQVVQDPDYGGRPDRAGEALWWFDQGFG